MIEISHLYKNYGKRPCLKDISFTVNKGEILGFLGPNGAGKTTTMSIITGYLSYTKGSVKVDGLEVLDNPTEVKKKIGYLPELPPVYLDMTVLEYLKFVYELKKVKLDLNKHIVEVMKSVGILDVKDRLIKHLSKGYKQRVGFASALIGDPEILILDEPTVGLDPKQIIEIRNVIKELGKSKTIIISSHILQEISAICDRVVIINKGVIRAIDTIENLEKNFTSNFIINIKIDGDKQKVEEVIKSFDGVKEISESRTEEGNINFFSIVLDGDADTVRTKLMSELIAKGFSIIEISTEKPNLEDVFIKLINQPVKKETLSDILESISNESDKTSDNDSANNEKEEN